MQWVRFGIEHLERIEIQVMQQDTDLCSPVWTILARDTQCWTLLGDDGTVVAIAGFYPDGKGSFDAWSLLSIYAKNYMFTITKKCVDILNMYNNSDFRLMVKPVDFSQAHRWARLLGFVESHRCSQYVIYLRSNNHG